MNKILKFALITILLFNMGFILSAQSGPSITGTILDASGIPIIGASVVEKTNPSRGASTDLDGKFSFELSSDDAVLVISYIGFVTQEITVGTQTHFDIVLLEDLQLLEELVFVGYGVQKKKLITGSTSQVGGEDIANLSSNGITGAIQSKVSGVSFTSSSGMPGTGQDIVIRGLGTIGNSSPLYVVDGVAGTSMAMLNPSDIQSIDILKDAASAAIYGSRAANGVVLITTKRGKKDHFEIRYDGYYATQNPVKVIEGVNAQDFIMLQEERLPNQDWATMLPTDLYNSIKDGSWKGSNFIEEMINHNAPMQNHAISLMGGSERSRFSAGYSFNEQEGIFGSPVVPFSKKHNARINTDNVMYKVGNLDVITVGAGMVYSYYENSGISVGNRFNNDIQNAISAPAVLPLYNKDGDFYNFDDAKSEGWNYDVNASNPIGLMVAKNQSLNVGHRLFANAYIEIQPIKRLKIRSAFGYKLNTSEYRKLLPVYNYSEKEVNSKEQVSQKMTSQYGWTLDNTISYDFRVNDHAVDIVLGQSLEKTGIGSQMSGSNTNMVFPDKFDYAWLSNTSGVDAALTKLSGGPYVNEMISSFFGRVNYDYKEKYLATVMLRADGSSVFAPGKQWGVFPSFSLGWVMSNESWMEGTEDWLDFIKLRASWGQNGNSRIANFQYLSPINYSPSSVYFFTGDKENFTQGAYATILANPDITWETSQQLDFGLDMNFFDSRLTFVFDWYKKETKDWLVKAPILASYGTGAPFINGGDVKNSGIELSLGWRDTINDFTYSVSINGSYNKNEVTRIANDQGIIEGKNDAFDQNTGVLYRAQEGMPIGYFYGYKTNGIFQNQAEVDATTVKVEDSEPGDIIYVDNDKDGKITPDDRTMIGNPNPDVIAGLNINLGYKGFDFAIVANGAFGQQVAQCYRPMTNKYYSNYPSIILENRWHGEGTSNTYPRLSNVNNFNRISDLFIKDASYVKIQNITLGYDFTNCWKNSPFSRFRLYASLQNFFTITNYDGMDPAVGYKGEEGWSNGIDLGFYPSAKSMIFGVNLTF